MATEETTSECLYLVVGRALDAVWNRMEDLGKDIGARYPLIIARQLARLVEKLSMSLHGRSQIVINIGRRTRFGQEIMPWLAIGCLCEDSLDEVSLYLSCSGLRWEWWR